jgi:hypothetical protein
MGANQPIRPVRYRNAIGNRVWAALWRESVELRFDEDRRTSFSIRSAPLTAGRAMSLSKAPSAVDMPDLPSR